VIDRALIDDCVHCGFCLPTCPTWGLWHEEMDSPRGRIHLMEALADGTVRLNVTVVEHFDRCLGCLACVSACPSGVRYDLLIEETRALVEEEGERPRSERAARRAILAVLPYPRRLRAALTLAPLGRALPGKLGAAARLAPPWRPTRTAPPARTPAVGEARARVGLLAGCAQRVLFGDVNAATARVLAAHGYEVVVPEGQGCCGALEVHSGRLDRGRERGRRVLEAFADVDYVVTNAAGCGSTLKGLDDRVRDVTELLAEAEPRAELQPLPLAVAYQDACHLAHGQGIRNAPRAVLRRVPGLELREPAGQDLCCGSAGIYNLVQPEAARELGDRKAAAVLATGADVYAGANPGCIVQVASALRRAGRPLPTVHAVELLDLSLRGVEAEHALTTIRR
jgi:glycolate oxidase iron-sulfur subunit